MTDEELVWRLRDCPYDSLNSDKLLMEAAARIEALTEQPEAARADAKEAEAYAEELEEKLRARTAERNHANDVTDAAIEEVNRLKALLAKASEALRGFMSKVDTACLVERDHSQAEFADAWRDAYAIIAEIEGEKT